MLTHETVAEIATDVLGAILGERGFDKVTVTDEVESDGDPALLVVARFKAGSKPADGHSTVEAIAQLRSRLRDAGELRFPLLRYDYPDDEIPYAEDDELKAWQ